MSNHKNKGLIWSIIMSSKNRLCFLFVVFVGPILKSSRTSKATIHQLELSLQLDEGFFQSPTTGRKLAIRVLASKAKDSKRMEVFTYLRRIAQEGTTGLFFNITFLNPLLNPSKMTLIVRWP